MTDFDPMKATAEERERALLVIGWTLAVIKNSTADAKVRHRRRARRPRSQLVGEPDHGASVAAGRREMTTRGDLKTAPSG
jgi:hypothetical protein